MGTTSAFTPQQPDLGQAYQDVYDILSNMYWESPDDIKDEVSGAIREVGDIITAIDAGDLAANTAQYTALLAKMKTANTALQKIKDDVAAITKNIATANSAVEAITKVVSLLPK